MNEPSVPALLRFAYAVRLRVARAFLGPDDTLASGA